MRDEQVYTVGLVVILLAEMLFTVPLLIDSMIGSNESSVIFILLIAHLVWMIYGKSWRLDRYSGIIHIMGIIAFFASFVPVIGFVFHGVVSYLIIKEIIETYRRTPT